MLPVQLLNVLAVEEQGRLEDMRNFNMERRIMREASDPFSLTNAEFEQLFRLNKDAVQGCLNTIILHLQQGTIPPLIKFCSALHFYATGSYQKVTGQNFNLHVSQQSMSIIVVEVTNAIITELSGQCIQFPSTQIDKDDLKQRFMEINNFPGVIGAVDGTHVALLQPHHQEHNYFNRKGYHSKNVQIACNFDLKILNVNPRYGGATHDAYIWRQSRLRREMKRCYDEADRNTWLVGDSGYPQEPWLMTPIENPQPGPESAYNAAHIRTRNCVERCIGVLKGRFRCLLLERRLRYSPVKTGNIIMACAILHNVCIDRNLQINFDLPLPDVGNDNRVINENPFLHEEGVDARANLVELYFH